MCYYNLKRWDEGLSECYQALKLDPTSLKGMYRRALILLEKQEYEEAIEQINIAIEIEPKNKTFLALKGKIHERRREYEAKKRKLFSKMGEG